MANSEAAAISGAGSHGMKLGGWRQDVAGGIAATLYALPIELIYGRILVAPLGSLNYISGIQAVLWTSVMAGLLAFVFRGTPGLINGTSAKAAFVLAALAASMLRSPEVLASANPVDLIFMNLFLCTVLTGLTQCVFALARFGRTLRFIPYPVIAGTNIGSGALMAKTALLTTFGISHVAASESIVTTWHPMSILVAATTLALCLHPFAFMRRLPVMLTAMVGGSLVHYGLVLAFGSAYLGGTWPAVNGLLPAHSLWQGGVAEGLRTMWHWTPRVLPYALAIAAIVSIESMQALPYIEGITHRKYNGEHELRTQGLINLVAGLFSALPSGAIGSRSGANVRAGGRRRVSGVIFALALALLVLVGGRVIAFIPEAVTAGVIFYLAYCLIDDGTRRLVRQLLVKQPDMPRSQYRILLANAAVTTTVALVAIFGDMLKATGVGVIAAMILFIMNSIKPVIRNIVTVQSRRSMKVRAPAATQLLSEEGHRVQVVELEGVLFFGTAERLAQEIGKLPDAVKILVLDFSSVREIDTTAARTMLQLAHSVKNRGQTLMLCGTNQVVESDFTAAGVKEVTPAEYWYHDTDHALEAAEDELLAQLGFIQSSIELTLDQTMLARGLSEEEVAVLARHMVPHQLAPDGVLFRTGEIGESLFVAADGVVDIYLPLRNGKKKRVASFAPGVIVGEMSFIDDVPRSADGHVAQATLVWELRRSSFAEMSITHPLLANKIMLNLSRGLAERLRTTTQNLRAASATVGGNMRLGFRPDGQVERRRYAR